MRHQTAISVESIHETKVPAAAAAAVKPSQPTTQSKKVLQAKVARKKNVYQSKEYKKKKK